MNWNYSKPPTDCVIMRWHCLWDCPIAVKLTIDNGEFCWIEKTLTTKWPDAAFISDVWATLPNSPVLKQKG